VIVAQSVGLRVALDHCWPSAVASICASVCDVPPGTCSRLDRLGSTGNLTELHMTEVMKAVFARASAADTAVHDLQVARYRPRRSLGTASRAGVAPR
jgi:hypothetical protein